MSRYCLFTFNPHPSDTKEFVQVMQSLLQPFLSKQSEYIFVREKKGRPEEHIHLLFTGDYKDKDKIKQKIENKAIKSFISTQIKQSNTDYKHCFDYLLVPQNDEDHHYYVGYVCKETDCNPLTKGFTQEYVSACVTYYNTVKRNQSQKIDNSWKHLKSNELHCYMEHYSQKLGIPLDDPNLVPLMKSEKISFNQITHKQLRITKDELVLANKDKVSEFAYNISKKSAQEEDNSDGFYYKMLFHQVIQACADIDKNKELTAEEKLKGIRAIFRDHMFNQ